MPAKPPAPGMKRYRVTLKSWTAVHVEVDAPDKYTAGVMASQLDAEQSPRVMLDNGGVSTDAVELTNPNDWEDPEEYGIGDPGNNPCSEW